eukprot:scaffold206533_cov30-Tisochrysis_lutea.AAC.4
MRAGAPIGNVGGALVMLATPSAGSGGNASSDPSAGRFKRASLRRRHGVRAPGWNRRRNNN